MKKILLVFRVCDENGKPLREGNLLKQYCFPALISNEMIYVKYEYANSQLKGEQYLVVKRLDAIDKTNEYSRYGVEVKAREVFVTEKDTELYSSKFHIFYIPGVRGNGYERYIYRKLQEMNKEFHRTQIPSKPIHTVY